MANYISNAPLWVIILFIASFLYSIAFIANPAKQAALNAGINPRKSRNIRIGIFVFYILYLAYVSVFSLKGVFNVNSLPPKVMVWAGVPLMIILFGFIGNTGLFKKLLRSITLESLVAIHVFRLLGVFFIILYFYQLLPAKFAFSAGLGDIITALLAFPVAKMVAKRKHWWKTAVFAWNIFGMLDIVNLLVIAVIIAKNAIVTGANGDLTEMTIFPFVWFPAFAPATILFLHTVVFRKLHQLKSANSPVQATDLSI
jgi:hypothetical protein